MPPSPAFRFSPRDLNHKRGRSLEGGLHLKKKDDDLVLFNDMQTMERQNFLLQSSDDLDDCFSTKLRNFSDFKLGVSIPARGEGSDLLTANGDKNDYDWLLTPPDTPLFPSLDDESPRANSFQRGRPRSQPISMSRTSMTDKSYRSSRSSASPHRLSSSPVSASGTSLSRGRPAHHTSPTPVLRPTTPARRSSTPTNRGSTPAPRSSTPTLRRLSTGSSGTPTSSTRSRTSPVKASRGNSASPKLRVWQSALPGFSSEPPRNLRTSPSDSQTSQIGGLSPASNHGRSSSYSKFGRQSMSPIASRSVNSSHSHEQDQFISLSKGSVMSSGDDDIDSLQSLPVAVLDRPALRKKGSFSNGRNLGFSKKPSRTSCSSSTPKRSFDYSLQPMDNYKDPPHMFRSLLSSAPSTTFYGGICNTTHIPMIARTSSATTSSNASSEQGGGVAPEIGASGYDPDDLTTDWEKTAYPVVLEEKAFVVDMTSEVKEGIRDTEGRACNNNQEEFDGYSTSQVEPKENEKMCGSHNAETVIDILGSSHLGDDPSEVNWEDMANCSICGNKFHILGPMDGDILVCPHCTKKNGNSAFISQRDTVLYKTSEEIILGDEVEAEMDILEYPEQTNSLGMVEQNEDVEQVYCLLDERLEKCGECIIASQVVVAQEVGPCYLDCDTGSLQLHDYSADPSLCVDASEGTSFPVLLRRSDSSKWPLVQGKAITARNSPSGKPFYVRDSPDFMSIDSGLGSGSACSSIDLSTFQQTEVSSEQLCRRKADLENSREDPNVKLLTIRSLEILDDVYEVSVHAISKHVDNLNHSVRDEAFEEKGIVSKEQGETGENIDLDNRDPSCVNTAILENNKLDSHDSFSAVASSASDLSSHSRSIQLEDTSLLEFVNGQDCETLGNDGDFQDNRKSNSDIGATLVDMQEFLIKENASISGSAHENDEFGGPVYDHLVMVLVEPEDDHKGITVLQNESAASVNSKSMVEALQEPPVSSTTENDLSLSAPESDTTDCSHGTNEETTVTIEGLRGRKSSSLTLEEATDTILFCSSIIHNLAYEAATIAMKIDGPVVPLEGLCPAVTILGAGSGRKHLNGRTAKCAPKSQKTKHKQLEPNTESLLTKTENDVKAEEPLPHDSAAPHKDDSMKPPKMEAKCNCAVM